MKQYRRNISLACAGITSLIVLAVAPVGAMPNNAHAVAALSDHESVSMGNLRRQAAQLLQQKRSEVRTRHSTAARQKACEQRQKSIDSRTNNFAAAAQRHLGVFNDIFTKLQNFYTSKHLTVSSYDSLVTTAQAKQAAAQQAVDDLKAVDVTIDCTAPDPAGTVATLQTTVKSARTSLQDYRASLKDIVVALKGASSAQTQSAQSDTQQSTPAATTNSTEVNE